MILSTDIWVGALVRRVSLGGAFAVVSRKGDPSAGAVLVRVANPRRGDDALYVEALRGDGERVWMQPRPGADGRDLDAYVERAAKRDPDVWVVEIEDVEGRHFLTETVEATPPASARP